MGKIYVVGLGPGNKENMTFRAYDVLKNSDIIIGYKTYVDLIEGMFPDKKIIKSYMKKEVARCEETLKLALEGNIISLISSGDAGVYGMAGLMLEIAGGQVEVEIVPGITSANASASLGGAPIVHDSVNISLSNLLTDWELIKKRIDLASQGDFVITLYNPKSSGRSELINEARDIMLKHKRKDTPVLIARNVGREGENYDITTLDKMLDYEINMFSTVIIGNSNTKVVNNKMITPRGYKV
ncbi:MULTISPECIES: precorrin-3B C(17)-methyltransferase [Fusobacterium]|uniref:precorrin-3B C(17)-methyltransferase n=1 Tax=Fusobacterium TaxID=848 RepID=UPI001F18B430|nr:MULTISPECIES: precorrin-3B C(17)-methyltransferase [Fusobacterium]MCF2612321.1 precorrin-3B C(17)-methyltransferase [Fusobacterium perfoetens]MDY2981246.1 precorrin-3B C(17)-methyltransferase [Fusobacterium sp.]